MNPIECSQCGKHIGYCRGNPGEALCIPCNDGAWEEEDDE